MEKRSRSFCLWDDDQERNPPPIYQIGKNTFDNLPDFVQADVLARGVIVLDCKVNVDEMRMTREEYLEHIAKDKK